MTGVAPYATFVTAGDIFGEETAAIAASTKASITDWARNASAASNGAVSPQILETMFQIQHQLIFEKNITVAEILTAASQSILGSVLWLLFPFSYGSVHLKQPGAVNDPEIDPRYLTVDFDLSVQISAGRVAQKIWYMAPLSDLIASNNTPGEDALPQNATDQQWTAFVESSCRCHWPVFEANPLPAPFLARIFHVDTLSQIQQIITLSEQLRWLPASSGVWSIQNSGFMARPTSA
jgi:choline dehydrogenase